MDIPYWRNKIGGHMNFLKRAFQSLRHYWPRTLLTTLMFTVLFAACVGSLVLYQTSKSQLRFMQETVKFSVILRPAYIWDRSTNTSLYCSAREEDLALFKASPYLSGYNYSLLCMGEIEDAKRLYPEERVENEKKAPGSALFIHAPVESASDRTFTMGGYRLVEGRHFTKDELNVILVSKEFAEYNGFTVGDHFTYVENSQTDNPQDMEIVGIFEGPPSEYVRGLGRTPEEMFIAPARFVQEVFHKSSVGLIQGFCENQENLDALVEELKEKINIVQIVEDPMSVPSFISPPEEFGAADSSEFSELLGENSMYVLEYTRQMYDMTASPMEKTNVFAGVMTIAFLTSAAFVLILSNTIFLKNKRREFGMLCAMGESKGKVVLQAAVEILVPILLAMLLGLAVGVSVGIPLVESLGSEVYNQNAEDVQGQNNLISYAHRGQNGYSTSRIYSAEGTDLSLGRIHNVVTPPKPEAVVDKSTVGGYFAIVVVLTLVTLVIQAGSVLRLKPAQILTRKN